MAKRRRVSWKLWSPKLRDGVLLRIPVSTLRSYPQRAFRWTQFVPVRGMQYTCRRSASVGCDPDSGERDLSVSSALSLEATATAWPVTESQSIYRIEPLRDPRWVHFVATHLRASVFHSAAWLEALSRTYGYKSFALTTSRDHQDLENALVFCRIESWLTGRRLVSLPFSDHCEPLLRNEEDRWVFATALREEARRERW